MIAQDSQFVVFAQWMDLASHLARADRLLALLSPDERVRGENLARKQDRENWLVGRGLLRETLGQIVGIAPDRIRFRIEKFGKPRLEDVANFDFSVSHSSDQLLLAWSFDLPVGADLEKIEPTFDWRPVASEALQPEEIRALESTEEDRQREAFYGLWCAKEAALKVRGQGVSHLASCKAASPPPWADRPEILEGIWACGLSARPGFAAAVSAPGRDWLLTKYEMEKK